MRRCARNAIFEALIVGLNVALLVALLGALFGGPFVGLFSGLFVGLISGRHAGGTACVKHFVLRLWLIRNGSTPWNYVRFLDHAAERILLRKVGGGYVFLHRMLLEYFAARYVESPVEKSSIAKPSPIEVES
jgi:hypothetical protein